MYVLSILYVFFLKGSNGSKVFWILGGRQTRTQTYVDRIDKVDIAPVDDIVASLCCMANVGLFLPPVTNPFFHLDFYVAQ